MSSWTYLFSGINWVEPAPPFLQHPHTSTFNSSLCRVSHLAPTGIVFFTRTQDVCDQAGANGFISISESEPLSFLYNHWLTQCQNKGRVLSWHHHVLKEDQGNGLHTVIIALTTKGKI